MEVKRLLTDDDAVSEVIAVVLLVAIVVVIAAVVASFALGLGGDADDEVQPNASFDFDWDESADEVTVTLTDGDPIEAQELFIRGQQITSSSEGRVDQASDYSSSSNTVGGLGGISSGTDEITSSQGVVVQLNSGSTDWVINVVWESIDADSGAGATLATEKGPDA